MGVRARVAFKSDSKTGARASRWKPWKRGNPSTDKQQTSVSHCCFLCFQIIIDVLLHPLGSKTISTAMTSTIDKILMPSTPST
ncbi:hypothetical protein F2P79_010619 [Pimephales promelas]|nr:hypothetical protein F2P79_010619 [Pimephales promelas]